MDFLGTGEVLAAHSGFYSETCRYGFLAVTAAISVRARALHIPAQACNEESGDAAMWG